MNTGELKLRDRVYPESRFARLKRWYTTGGGKQTVWKRLKQLMLLLGSGYLGYKGFKNYLLPMLQQHQYVQQFKPPKGIKLQYSAPKRVRIRMFP